VVLLTVALTDDGGFGTPTSFGCNTTVLEAELDPTALTARTLNEYDTPPVRPAIRDERYAAVVVAAVAHVAPASMEDSTMYPVTTLPPLEDGSLQYRNAEFPERKPDILLGALATDGAGGVAVTATEAWLSPMAFSALTRNICEIPPVKPVNVNERTDAEIAAARFHVVPESVEYWATYPVMEVPPLVLGVDQYRDAAL